MLEAMGTLASPWWLYTLLLTPIEHSGSIFSMSRCHNLSHDRQRHFFWRCCTNIQSNWPMDAPDLLFCYSLFSQPLIALFFCLATTDGSNITHFTRQHHL